MVHDSVSVAILIAIPQIRRLSKQHRRDHHGPPRVNGRMRLHDARANNQFFSDRTMRLRSESIASMSSVSLVMLNKICQPISLNGAMQRAELYFATHPASPSAINRPIIILRSGTWIAIMAKNVSESIVGFGETVETALQALDAQYWDSLREATNNGTAERLEQRGHPQDWN